MVAAAAATPHHPPYRVLKQIGVRGRILKETIERIDVVLLLTILLVLRVGC